MRPIPNPLPTPVACAAALLLLGLCACKSSQSAGGARAEDQSVEATRTSVTEPTGGSASGGSSPAAGQAFADLTYLSSDELRGRYTGSAGNRSAAEYIQRSFRASGARPVPGAPDMLTPVKLVERTPITKASMRFGESPDLRTVSFPEGLVPLTRSSVDLAAPAVYLTQRQLAACTADQARGKIIISAAGGDEAPADPRTWIALAHAKQARLDSLGAVASVEVYRSQVIPFKRLVGGVNGGGMAIDEGGPDLIPIVWVAADTGFSYAQSFASPRQVQLLVDGAKQERLTSHNVIATLPGTDPSLASEYIAVTAHFDHIGVTHVPGVRDSINNGARDNGMGTVALLEVARRWSANPGKRPLLLMAWTAEEVGLLGSRYWADRPTVPLSMVRFNFNLDGAGYDDTTGVVFNGYDRSSAQGVIDAAVASTGLRPMPDPMPDYGLFRQSDNYSLATKGIPAVNMAPGFTGFSEELMKYFHQPADEITAVDPRYLQRYCDAAVAAVKALSDMPALPTWVPGDEYEATAKTLYSE